MLLRSIFLAWVAPLAFALSYNSSTDYGSGNLGLYPSQTYQSSNITPVAWNFVKYPDTTPLPGYILLAPRGSPSVPSTSQGPYMFDWNGDLMWSGVDVAGQTMSYEIFTYNGSQVIAVWTGSFNGGGYGDGYGLIVDNTYKVIATVNTTLNSQVDFHEFRLTDNGTALITVYETLPYNLSSFGVQTDDPAGGYILTGHIQEIDIATGQALFTWNALDHVNPNMSYADPGSTGTAANNAFDYIHLNAIDKDAKGNYLISARHCHAVYYVDKDSGDILWTLNGMNSSFAMGNGTTFEWQHHARWHTNDTQISIFDNAATDFAVSESQARGLLINLDMSNMSTSLAVEALPYQHVPSGSQGNMDLQPDGNWLIGWGEEAYFSEHDSTGNLLWAVQFGINSTQGYRVHRSNWTAYPTTNPNMSVSTNSSTNDYDVYVSWNGATEVKLWNVYGASATDGTGLSFLQSANKSGFETYISIPQSAIGSDKYFQIMAADTNNQTLGFTEFSSIDGTSKSPVASAESSSIVSHSVSQTSSMSPSASGASASSGSSATSGAADLRASVILSSQALLDCVLASIIMVFGGLGAVL